MLPYLYIQQINHNMPLYSAGSLETVFQISLPLCMGQTDTHLTLTLNHSLDQFLIYKS